MNIRVEQALTAEPAISWMVINRIYETGQHPEQWPGLLMRALASIDKRRQSERGAEA